VDQDYPDSAQRTFNSSASMKFSSNSLSATFACTTLVYEGQMEHVNSGMALSSQGQPHMSLGSQGPQGRIFFRLMNEF